MADILDAILNFSNCSRVTTGHQAVSENRDPWLPKSTVKNLNTTMQGSGKKWQLAPRLVWFVSGAIMLFSSRMATKLRVAAVRSQNAAFLVHWG